ncbi:hypothetical protein BDY19DRAFT_960226 [Irpex rosettiformis]|uniref:Uncharacterized protein n=1 Tax=Irpex rosettiformis TaxID=378272 RepID=A0ACB8TWV4_9APHY|nr:hypothetical protein BDY19DRAFT_960226 [Irpex rosettiformis]
MTTRPRSLSMGDLMGSRGYRMPEPLHMMYSRRLGSIMARAADSSREAFTVFLANLPKMSEKELVASGHADSSCPICLNPFSAILTEEEMALAMDTPAHAIEDLGVTRLGTCGHVFCAKDIRNWVLQGHNSCPFCRSVLINLPPTDSDAALAEEVSVLQRQMHASLAAFGNTAGNLVPLTPEQVASLRSAIMLLQQGDGLENLEFTLPGAEPIQVEAHRLDGHDDVYDDDRESFGGMYS